MKDYFKCPKTWSLFSEGKTKGVFQLESNLGRSWSKKVAPSNIEELSALISIIRPGCGNVIVDGKPMTLMYVERKHGREPVKYLHDALEPILKSTYGVLVYQEQSMLMSTSLAGFNLQEADELRKAIGKKKADLMAKVKTKFLSGCETEKVVDMDTATEIFSWIEKSAKYQFNKSHGISYAYDAYDSAWWKVHDTYNFFQTYLEFAPRKPKPMREVYELVSESKVFNINTALSKIDGYSPQFEKVGDTIRFGVKNIQGLTGVTGDKVVEAIKKVEGDLGKAAADFTWMDILIVLGSEIDATSFKALSGTGFFTTVTTGVTRNRALYEYEIFRSLTVGEKKWVLANYPEKQWSNLTQCITDVAPQKKNGGGAHTADRTQTLQSEIHFIDNPPYDLQDDPTWIVDQEAKLIGCPISLARIDAADTTGANTSCKDILNGKNGKGLSIAGSISRIANFKVKKGKTAGQLMSFLTIEDETCSLDGVILFPDTRKQYEYQLYEGNNLLFLGSVDKKDTSFIVDKIHEI